MNYIEPDRLLTPGQFVDTFMRLKRGSITRRHFLAATGLGIATAVLAGAGRPLAASTAPAPGSQVSLATWPNYHDPATLDAFTLKTGVAVEVNVFGSNEEMLAKLQSGEAGWDLFVPTRYTIPTYMAGGLLQELDLATLPNFNPAAENPRFIAAATLAGKTFVVPKNWGTTGMACNTRRIDIAPTSWKEFFEVAMAKADGRTILHDYQLTTVGNALVARGYSFNSVNVDELAEAEKLLIEVKPHLYAITSDYQPAMRAGDAWLTVSWTNDGAQMNRDLPEIEFFIGRDGGEIWTDYYAIPRAARNKPGAYALLNYLMDPAVAVKEHLTNSAPATDSRVMALLPEEITSNRIIYPDDAALTKLEFAAANTLVDPGRTEVMRRFRAA